MALLYTIPHSRKETCSRTGCISNDLWHVLFHQHKGLHFANIRQLLCSQELCYCADPYSVSNTQTTLQSPASCLILRGKHEYGLSCRYLLPAVFPHPMPNVLRYPEVVHLLRWAYIRLLRAVSAANKPPKSYKAYRLYSKPGKVLPNNADAKRWHREGDSLPLYVPNDDG